MPHNPKVGDSRAKHDSEQDLPFDFQMVTNTTLQVRRLINEDRIKEGCQLLQNYASEYGSESNLHLRLTFRFLMEALANCRHHQASAVGRLLDEHVPAFDRFFRDLLRRHELQMYERCCDKEGISKCQRLLGDRVQGPMFNGPQLQRLPTKTFTRKEDRWF